MGSTTSPLQTPYTSPNTPTGTALSLSLSHRIVLAPMTRMRASNTTAAINPSAATYYAERTTPGSLLISEGTIVSARGKGFPCTPGIWTSTQARAWKPITDAVHAKGGTFFMQLWHVGRVSVPSVIGGARPFSSTSAHLPGSHVLFGGGAGVEAYVDSHAMTTDDIRDVVAQFAHAAKLAVEVAGFDGVEIHGANGYLLDSFVHDNINTRTDGYGGSLANRLRFPLEVVDAVIGAVGARRTAIRLAPYHVLQETGDSNRIATFSAFAAELERRGLAYVHIVEPRYDQGSGEGAFSGDIKRDGTSQAQEGGDGKVNGEKTGSIWPFRRILKNTTVIGAGGYDAASAAKAIEEGRIDLAAFGRYFTSNPDLPERLFRSLPLTKYHRPTFYTPGEEGYLGWARWSETSE
ncbi:alkene reductase [Aspergillus mulundensis]|uniref:Putative NADH:flavin oxidoreductase reductase n=1 Tax=Aspergillus mulundensis TaxID=1810919 RepID=A0A3D8QZU6_9EURO|nr:putative NADH:flavin oxidoreductase reductase [Aspergillus mulundensis]RDW67181.1 putative NADH:flavin oxidoreductase reductase [Aspergillus mulundensis]